MPTPHLLRQLPSVGQLLEQAPHLSAQFGHDLAVLACRAVLDGVREELLAGGTHLPTPEALADQTAAWLADYFTPTLRPVINATGVIIHTNLGRAPLSGAAQAAVTAVGGHYNTLEYDLASGQRGSRMVHAEQVLRRVAGAEAAVVVNNNAAAMLLMLSGLCAGQEVLISRGQLVEIGGGFRIPDILRQSGAKLVEVGTTNRTHLRDYAQAIGPNTAAILVVHASNYQIIGFTSAPEMSELAELTRKHGLYLLYDQGSGALLDTAAYGLAHEPTVQEGLQAGADVVAFSGDKLVGGPQAGILVGRTDLIHALKQHPLARAVRADKLALAGLSATLEHYLKGEAEREIPIWRMMARPLADIRATAEAWAGHFTAAGLPATTRPDVSTVGGGSLPGTSLPSHVVAIPTPHPNQLAARLRQANPPIIGRIQSDHLLLDPRTVLLGQEDALTRGILSIRNPKSAIRNSHDTHPSH